MNAPRDPAVPTVFIVDDDPSICEGICNLLEAVGINSESFDSCEDFLDRWTEQMAGCLILDVQLPGITGTEFQERLLKEGIHVPIIFMTAHGDIPMVRKVMKAGAVEFLTKPFQKEDLLTAIQQAFDADLRRRKEEHTIDSLQSLMETLTSREREVMEMVTAGYLNKQIADHLNLSEITVKLHRRHVMEKMRAGSIVELVRIADRVKGIR
jgi:FixJ family two-component response regulator